jgi:hypothetical protein
MRGRLSENTLRRIVRVALMEVAGDTGPFKSALDKAGEEVESRVYGGDGTEFSGLAFVSLGQGNFKVKGQISGDKILNFIQDSARAKYEGEMKRLGPTGVVNVQMTDLLGITLPRLNLRLENDSTRIDMQKYAVLGQYTVPELFEFFKNDVSDEPGDTSNKIFVDIGARRDQIFPLAKSEPKDALDRIVTWIEKNPQELPYKKGQKVWPYFRNLLRSSLLELVKNKITIPNDPEASTRAILANLSAFAKKKNVTGGLNDQVKALAESIPVADDKDGTKSADFGPLTDLATRVFQAAVTFGTKEFNLDIDGLMGEETIKAMVNVVDRGTTRGELFNLPPSPAKK